MNCIDTTTINIVFNHVDVNRKKQTSNIRMSYKGDNGYCIEALYIDNDGVWPMREVVVGSIDQITYTKNGQVAYIAEMNDACFVSESLLNAVVGVVTQKIEKTYLEDSMGRETSFFRGVSWKAYDSEGMIAQHSIESVNIVD